MFARFDAFKVNHYPSSEDNDAVLLMRLWALIISAATALDETETEWYAARILPLIRELNLSSKSEIEFELKKYIWTSANSTIFVKKIWSRLEHRLNGIIDPQ